jgi:hypothetical protein
MRQDFNLMLGDLQDLLDGTVRQDDETIAELKKTSAADGTSATDDGTSDK